MNKKVALSFVVVGIVLLGAGLVAYHSTNGAVSRALTHGSTDTALCLIIAGMLAGITGAFALNERHSKES